MDIFWIVIREEDIPGKDIRGGKKPNVQNISRKTYPGRHQKDSHIWERRQDWSKHRAHKWDFSLNNH